MQFNKQKQEYQEKYNSFRNHPAFSRLNNYIIKALIDCVYIQSFIKNQSVYIENELMANVYIVKSGEFKMSKRILYQNSVFYNQKRWKQFEICLLEKGETFGIEHQDEEPKGCYKYSVTCQSYEGSLYSLKLDQITQILQDNYIKVSVDNLFQYQQQLSKNRLYINREQQINQLYSNITQSLKHREIRSFQNANNENLKIRSQSNVNNEVVNNNNRFQNRSISYDISYCDKIQSLINYQKQIINNPRRIIKTEILEDDNYVNQSVNNHIRALKPFISNFASGRNLTKRTQPTSQDKIEESNQNEKIFKLKVLLKLGCRPKNNLQIRLHQIHSQHLSKMFPFHPK
ncbi:unnamed protein product (macronuclear) [Paramecium tetraurelia]|uniref:Cyclic nucleotide-binding domain-containing protein n=1 Tax=Paramecium tetraurelia TaxID=5888 RepID=A0E0N9_PARTE|nr:uncharacterized protein GSPATT00022024001 [Paramecium tetraurelia]CAK88856.1 unnamed protein product [Paramecium tetraurelia]|eukprot:XP_001456253.1 hypothetical protein (macronuclear) [Paramecium tetraurelia strain d4-2]